MAKPSPALVQCAHLLEENGETHPTVVQCAHLLQENSETHEVPNGRGWLVRLTLNNLCLISVVGCLTVADIQ